MEDFLVRRRGGGDDYMYIGFTEIRNESMMNCSGLAKVRVGDKYEYWFNYSFLHSIDWSQVTGITLRPNQKYKMTMEELRKVGSDIIFYIREFIARMN
jgi:hypothetical protein